MGEPHERSEGGGESQQLVFVYGTLKQGFSNHPVNSGTRVPGVFETAVPYPLYIIGPYYLPWLVDRPGEGARVIGQLFRVDSDGFLSMDELEQVDEPGWYTRGRVVVRRLGMAHRAGEEAIVYFGAGEALSRCALHAGPVSEWTAAHDAHHRRLRL
jgi:gamma-glutamylaminecyclotransferase